MTPWQKALAKRTHKNKRLIALAHKKLEEQAPSIELPPHHVLGVHLALIVLANCSTKLVEIRARARWLLHWMLGYLIEQGFTVEEASSPAALDAVEAIVIAAVQAKTPHVGQLQLKSGVLLLPDKTPVPTHWQKVYDSAWQFISALNGLA